MSDLILTGLQSTLIMVFVSAFFAFIIGLPIAVILFLTRPNGLKEQPVIFAILDTLINITRSIPFVLLMIILLPLSRLIVGTSIGTIATIIPLSLSAAPFMARMIEQNLLEIDNGIIQAALSMGASRYQIIKLLLHEAMPALVVTITVTMINIVGYSAIAGTIGGGGLGDVAIRHGLYLSNYAIMWTAIILIILLVQMIQFLGTKIAYAISKK